MRLGRLLLLGIVVLLSLITLVQASNWDKDDHEIFDLQAALESSDGPSANFYKILQIPKSASAKAIKAAYRKRSLELHPDRNPNDPKASKRFETLGLINKILQDHRRDRYDHFLQNGFPKWRGTGYFYSRFRPGLSSVLVFLILASSAIQHLIQVITWKSDLAKMKNLKRTGWIIGYGPRYSQLLHAHNTKSTSDSKSTSNLLKEKKVKIPLSGYSNLPLEPTSDEIASGSVDWEAQEKALKAAVASNVASTGGMLDGGQKSRNVDALITPEMVYLAHPATGEWLPLDEEEQPRPRFPQDTWPATAVRSLMSRFGGKSQGAEGELEQEAGQDTQVDEDEGNSNSVATAKTNGNGSSKKRKGGAKRK